MDSLRTGYMTKCGKTVKSWKRRWFVLKPNGFLYYYTDPSCKKEKGHIDIINCGSLSLWNVTDGDKLSDPAMETRTFLVNCSDRTYTCVCDSDAECRIWLETLHKVHDGSEPQHYPPPTYHTSETPPVSTTAVAPPMHPVVPQTALAPPISAPMPQPSPQMPRHPVQQPMPQQLLPPYPQYSSAMPRPSHQPPPDYRHSIAGPLPTYYPPPMAQPRFYSPPTPTRSFYPPPACQPVAYGPPSPRPPGYHQPRPPVQFAPRPPVQFAPRPYAPPPSLPQQPPRVVQQQQSNVVVVNI